jgi:hypothetical protein
MDSRGKILLLMVLGPQVHVAETFFSNRSNNYEN